MTAVTPVKRPNAINGFNISRIQGLVGAIQKDPAEARIEFEVRSSWKGQTRSEARVESYRLGGKEIAREFTIAADEPLELDGSDIEPNPQELLMAALNACMIVGYAANAALRGVSLDRLEIESKGAFDLRGLLGLDPEVPAGYEKLRVKVMIAGDGTPDQFREIHAAVQATSPNLFNLARAVRIVPELVLARPATDPRAGGTASADPCLANRRR
jgi:uncharacterized OsmC-like protein